MRASKKVQKEDVKSTAYSFTLISIIGFVLLILFALGLLPVQIAGYMKIMITVIMGIMLAIFLIIGIRSFGELKRLDKEADTEEKNIAEITEWFCSNYSAADIDRNLDTAQPTEALYYSRYDVMSRLILAKYPSLGEDFLDNLIEDLYAVFF